MLLYILNLSTILWKLSKNVQNILHAVQQMSPVESVNISVLFLWVGAFALN